MLQLFFSGNFSFTRLVVYFLSSCSVIFLTMPVHELAHAFAATKLGDPTPKYQGRLSLNPFHHIDYFGALCTLLFGFGWAKPVMINTRNFDDPKKDMALTALAGPVANLIVAFVAVFFANMFMYFYFRSFLGILELLVYFFEYIAIINISLAIFNLIPIPPLDGSRLLNAFLPDRIYYQIMQYERYLFLLVLLLCYTGVLGKPLSIASSTIYNFFSNITGWIFGL